jgi:cysteine desulfurase
MNMERIYLDNAASTPLDAEVLEQMIAVLREYQGNPSSVHSHGRQLRNLIEKARKEIAEMLGAAPSEIFFTSGGTEADNIAIKCSIESQDIGQVISSKIEHHAVTHSVEELALRGLPTHWLPVDQRGFPDLNALESLLQRGPKALVSLMHANNELGTMIDLNQVAALCERYGALFHSDTVQTMAHVHYHLAETPIHFVTASAHKFYGPKGVGFLYVKSGTRIPPLICGGSQERNMRAGTENVAGIVAMAYALKKCYGAYETKTAHLWNLKQRMKAGLERIVPGVEFNGAIEMGQSIPTVLNVAFPSAEADSMMLFNLDINGISASGGSACTSGSVKGSHVLEGIGLDPLRAANSVRFSFGVQNTVEEIDRAVEKIGSFAAVGV